MNYIGSKLQLLNFIEQSINEVTGGSYSTVLDLFAGTGAVGRHFKERGRTVIANDLQYYSFALNRHYIGNNSNLSFAGLADEFSTAEDTRAAVFSYLENLKGKKGFIYRNYCLGGTTTGAIPRQYFSDENGARCDAIRQKIEDWKSNGRINDDEYFFLLASLLESIDKRANTASVYGAFLKHLKKTAAKRMEFRPADSSRGGKNHKVYNEDINKLVRRIKGDILYLDPPYNHRQYSGNYHVLETIARYDNPKIFGKTGTRDSSEQRSEYSMRRRVRETFTDLVLRADVKYIFLSYNNEGLMSEEEIKMILGKRGKYGVFTQEYGRFRADKAAARNHKADKVVEYLHYVKCTVPKMA